MRPPFSPLPLRVIFVVAVAAIPRPSFADATNPRIGVVCVGADPSTTGDLQRDLELRMAAIPGASVRGAGEISRLLGVAAPARSTDVDPAFGKEAAVLLEQATIAYYKDKPEVALDRLNALGALHGRQRYIPPEERIRLRLWRSIVLSALNDVTKADDEALAALVLDPSLSADLTQYPPSAKATLDRLRARRLKLVILTLDGLPADARVFIDDRPASARTKIAAGAHRLSVSAPGRRDVSRTFDAATDATFRVTLPIALEPAMEQALGELVWRGGVLSAGDVRGLAALAATLQIDWLVLGGVRSEPVAQSRVVVLSLAPKPSLAASSSAVSAPSERSWIAVLGTWAQTALQSALNKKSGVPLPAAGPAIAKAGRWRVLAEGEAVVSRRTRLREGGDLPADVMFVGVGPRLSIGAERGAFIAGLEASWIEYGLTWVAVTEAAGTEQKVRGGSTTSAHAGAGARWLFGAKDPDGSAAVAIRVGGVYESHAAADLKDEAGLPQGLLTSYSETAAEVRIDGRVPLGASGFRPMLLLGAGATPVRIFSESPSGTTGSKPEASPGLSWRLGLALHPGRTRLLLLYTGETRTVSFAGPGASAGDPTLADARITESFHALALAARWNF